MLSWLLGSSVNSLKVSGVKSIYQQQVYNVESNGLLLKPATIECELVHGRLLSYYNRIAKDKDDEREGGGGGGTSDMEKMNEQVDLLKRVKDLGRDSRMMIKTCDYLISDSFSVRAPSRGDTATAAATATAIRTPLPLKVPERGMGLHAAIEEGSRGGSKVLGSAQKDLR